EQVVEVVGDAAREAPDRLHLLRLAQLLFAAAEGLLGALALGDLLAQVVVEARQLRGSLADVPLELALRLLAPFVSRLAIGDVLRDAEQVAGLAARPEDRDLARVQPAEAARRLERLLGDVDQYAALEHPAVRLLEGARLVSGEQREVVAPVEILVLDARE